MKQLLRHIARIFAACVFLFTLVAALAATDAGAQEPQIPVYLFWQKGCPYCAAAHSDLDTLAETNPAVDIVPLELGPSPEINALFEATVAIFGLGQAAVPLVVIGNRPFLGYLDGGRSAELYRQAVERCLGDDCPDVIGKLAGGSVSERGTGEGRLEPVLEGMPGLVTLGCEVRPGESGSPVVRLRNLAAPDRRSDA